MHSQSHFPSPSEVLTSTYTALGGRGADSPGAPLPSVRGRLDAVAIRTRSVSTIQCDPCDISCPGRAALRQRTEGAPRLRRFVSSWRRAALRQPSQFGETRFDHSYLAEVQKLENAPQPQLATCNTLATNCALRIARAPPSRSRRGEARADSHSRASLPARAARRAATKQRAAATTSP